MHGKCSRDKRLSCSAEQRPSSAKPPEVGISYVEGTVRGAGGAEERVRFLIDSGATYSLLPEAALMV